LYGEVEAFGYDGLDRIADYDDTGTRVAPLRAWHRD
jgi:hypothetical protein